MPLGRSRWLGCWSRQHVGSGTRYYFSPAGITCRCNASRPSVCFQSFFLRLSPVFLALLLLPRFILCILLLLPYPPLSHNLCRGFRAAGWILRCWSGSRRGSGAVLRTSIADRSDCRPHSSQVRHCCVFLGEIRSERVWPAESFFESVENCRSCSPGNTSTPLRPVGRIQRSRCGLARSSRPVTLFTDSRAGLFDGLSGG